MGDVVCSWWDVWNPQSFLVLPIYILEWEVGVPITDTTSTITRSTMIILSPNIGWIMGTVAVWMTHKWRFHTLRCHKRTYINTSTNFMGGKVDGTRTNTTFTITTTNNICRTTQSTKWKILTKWWYNFWGYALMLKQINPLLCLNLSKTLFFWRSGLS